jgi:hypothetical protein
MTRQINGHTSMALGKAWDLESPKGSITGKTMDKDKAGRFLPLNIVFYFQPIIGIDGATDHSFSK